MIKATSNTQTIREFPVEAANAYYIKHIPGKKTDERDSKWIVQLCRNNQQNPSRIFQGSEHDLRTLTRYCQKLIEELTTEKNTTHPLLDSSNITLSNYLSDIFRKSGMPFFPV